jgi:hypothetical protein
MEKASLRSVLGTPCIIKTIAWIDVINFIDDFQMVEI